MNQTSLKPNTEPNVQQLQSQLSAASLITTTSSTNNEPPSNNGSLPVKSKSKLKLNPHSPEFVPSASIISQTSVPVVSLTSSLASQQSSNPNARQQNAWELVELPAEEGDLEGEDEDEVDFPDYNGYDPTQWSEFYGQDGAVAVHFPSFNSTSSSPVLSASSSPVLADFNTKLKSICTQAEFYFSKQNLKWVSCCFTSER